jgi:hypothetical protein
VGLVAVPIDGQPPVSEDGQTLLDDNPESGPTNRDAEGNVVNVLKGGPPATGMRMRAWRLSSQAVSPIAPATAPVSQEVQGHATRHSSGAGSAQRRHPEQVVESKQMERDEGRPPVE